MMQKFGPWLPDFSSYSGEICTDVTNVVPPSTSGFRAFKTFSSVASALSARPQGAVSQRGLTGTIYNFSGDATKLYKMASDGLSWEDVSRTSGGAYATPSDGWWNYALFGDYCIAVNLSDDPQAFQLSTSTDFAALAGSPPKAAFAGVLRDFVFLARISTAYNRVQWSGINDIEEWTPSDATMSDYQDVPDSGVIKGFVGGEYGILFLERAINRVAFEGPPTIFRFDKIAQTLGCQIEGSVAAYENLVFFKAHDGFYMVRGGAELVPIGSERVDRWTNDNINSSHFHRCSSAIDPDQKLYCFSFASSVSGDGTPDTILIYHWPSGEWSKIETAHSMIYTSAVQATLTIDMLPGTDDELPYSFGSLYYSGAGNLILSGFDTSFRQGFFSGSNMAASVQTGFFEFAPGRKVMLRRVRPIIEGTDVDVTVTPITKNLMHEAEAEGTAATVNANGVAPVRSNARYHSLRVETEAGDTWSKMTGVSDIIAVPMGRR